MLVDDVRYLRAWPEGKEVLSLGVADRRLVSITSRTGEIAFDPNLDGYEWRVVAQAMAESILSYQKLCNTYADELYAIKVGGKRC